jgi:phosphate transport system permease protein
MRLSTRKLLDRAFTGVGLFSILLMGLALLFILGPIFSKGASALVFRQTVEHRRFLLDKLQRGAPEKLADEMRLAQEARQPVYQYLTALDDKITTGPRAERRQYRQYQEPLDELKKLVRELLGPMPGESIHLMTGEQYGQTRWERAQKKAHQILYIEEYDYSDPTKLGVKVFKPRIEQFRGTPVEPLFEHVEQHLEEMLRPQWTFYGGFLFDMPFDSYMLGGIWPSILGTFYLTLGAMLLAAPLGIVAAVYFVEYGDENFLAAQLFSLIPRGKTSGGETSDSLRDKAFKIATQIERNMVSMLRICVSTLAGVPSIVFGLFGLAFLIHTINLSETKSVLAGSATLALLILPTIIRASEEAIRAVPHSYREAAVGLGAGKWRTIWTVILPAALPGILTGTIISMGRAAGETAPIIFTAAVSLGTPLSPLQALSQPTPALPWSIYILSTEHAALDQIRHVQYGMVFVLILLVLGLNLTAILLRARIARKIRG